MTKLTLCALIIFSISSFKATAVSCGYIKSESENLQADVKAPYSIAIGTVESKSKLKSYFSDKIFFNIKATKWLKGKLSGDLELIVFDPSKKDDYYDYLIDKEYIFFFDKNGDSHLGMCDHLYSVSEETILKIKNIISKE